MKFRIHVGPPKTGTSAIQRWCLEHSDILLANGVLYPKHDIDVNGVSSGNLLSLFERGESSELVFSAKKLEDLKRQADSLGVETVLLSSEFFFKQIPVLSDAIPEAIFIAYIRFELSALESGYNQSVKRHNMADLLKVPDNIKSKSLALISQYVKGYGEARFNLRAYGQETFDGGNIVSDLITALSIPLKSLESISAPQKINTGYSLEGLEYKRWFNHLSANSLQTQLDKFLQSEARDADLDYSILSGSDFWRLRKFLLRELKVFCRDHKVHNKQQLIEESEALAQSKVRMQHIGLKTFRSLTERFIEFDANNKEYLQSFLGNNSGALQCCEDKLRLQEIELLLSNSKQKRFVKKSELARLCGYASRKIAGLTPRLFLKSERQASLKNKVKPTGENCSKPQLDDSLILSFEIPFVGNDSFVNVLKSTYDHSRLFICSKNNYKILLQRSVPKEIKIIHGHAMVVDEVSRQFPRAINICWVRDPLERLWEHYQSVLLREYPENIYEKLMNLSATKKIVNDKYLFVAMLEDPEFLDFTEAYSRCIGPKIQTFDFVGSIANYERDIHKLESILGVRFQLTGLDNNSELPGLPRDLLKYKSLLKNDYELVESFL